MLPVRDAARFVGEALDCLRAQRGVELHVVAVDDGSRDHSLEILRRAAADWPALQVLAGPAAGVPAALERGRAVARAPWIGRMDADDTCPPERFAVLLERATAAGEAADVVGSRIEAFGAAPVSHSMQDYLAWQNDLLGHDEIVRNRFVESPLAHATALIRASTLASAGGWDPGAPWSEDLDLWCRLAEAGARFAKVDRCLYRWRMHDTQATRVDPRCSATQMRACKVHYLARGPLSGRAVELWSVGLTLQRWTDALADAGCEVHPRPLRPLAGEADGGLAPRSPDRVVLAVYGAASVRRRIAAAWSGPIDGLWFAA